MQAAPLSTLTQPVLHKPDATKLPAVSSRGSAPGLGRPPLQHTLSGPAGSQQYLQNHHFSPVTLPNPTINNRLDSLSRYCVGKDFITIEMARVWTYSSLRPSPPITTRPCPDKNSKKSNKNFRKRGKNQEI